MFEKEGKGRGWDEKKKEEQRMKCHCPCSLLSLPFLSILPWLFPFRISQSFRIHFQREIKLLFITRCIDHHIVSEREQSNSIRYFIFLLRGAITMKMLEIDSEYSTLI